MHRTIDQIIETRDGDVFLNFRKNLSQLTRSLSTRQDDLSYRVSLPASVRPSVSALSIASEPRDNGDNISFEGIKISSNLILHGIYQYQSNLRRTFLTASEVNFSL